ASVVGPGSNSYSIWLAGDTGQLTAAIETDIGHPITLQSRDIFADTTSFHHVALTYDGGVAKFFLDGGLQESQSYSGTILDTPFDVLIGRRSGTGADGHGDVLQGLVDEPGIFNRALSDSEIARIVRGARTISPLSGLPKISDPVVIDGYTQPG